MVQIRQNREKQKKSKTKEEKKTTQKNTPKKARAKKSVRRVSKGKKRSVLVMVIFGALWVFSILALSVLGYISYCQATLPEFSKAIYVERQPGVKILAEDGRELASYGALFAEPVDVDKLPKYVAQAVVDTEDRRFYKHGGFDYIGFFRAMGVNLFKRRYAQGASTITQQVAKNLFLTQEKSVRRKVQEFLLARWLEKHFSKKQILNIYLNRVFFGSGAYGLNNAAKRFFNKKAKDLNLHEAAILAGVLKAPSRYNYLRHKKASLERAKVVLSVMKRAGTISQEELNKALLQPVGEGKEQELLGIRYFGDYIMSELPKLVEDYQDDIYVQTTLDYNLQRRAEYVLRKHLRAHKKDRVSEGAVVILDKFGAIKAMVGGFDYNKSQFNRAAQAFRQAGSSFKLFVYLTAFEKGFSEDDMIMDEPIKIGQWEPQNYDKQFHGKVSLKQAFAKSLNAATVDLATHFGLDDIIDMALRLGITTNIKAEPSIILGASEVRLIDMAAAYTTTFNGGYAVFPFSVQSVIDSHKQMLYKHRLDEREKVLSDDVVQKIGVLEREVVLNGTGKRAGKVYEARGKTGTSQNYRDAWFIGSNSKYTAAVWVGNDDNSPMKEIGGGSVPTEIWAEIMK